MRPRVGIAMVAITAASIIVAGCGKSTVGQPVATSPSESGRGAKTACELITPAVIRAAHFPDHVAQQVEDTRADKYGASGCTYGDDPNRADISPSYLLLLVFTPARLAQMHTTERAEIEAVASPCAAVDVRGPTANAGLGSYSYFCVREDRAPNGGWIQGGNAYLLEVGYPDVNYGSATERTAEFESVARAIAKNVGG